MRLLLGILALAAGVAASSSLSCWFGASSSSAAARRLSHGIRKEQKEAARQRRLEEERTAPRPRAAAAAADDRRRDGGRGGARGRHRDLPSGGAQGDRAADRARRPPRSTSQVNSLLNGIPQSGATLGKPTAPVTMTYYGDLECPICQDSRVDGGFPQLVANEVRQGKVKVVYRAFETATQDPSTFKTQQVAALAAGQQNRFWDFAELFYHQQGAEDSGYVTEAYLTGSPADPGSRHDHVAVAPAATRRSPPRSPPTA